MPASVQSSLWGRDREVDQILRLVRSIDGGARFVVIRGDAGIGKTAMWRWGVEQHRAAGHRVLVTRPAQEELHGPMTGLLDLFEDTDPAPGTLDPEADVFDRGRAVLRTLRSLASAGPVAVAIDDIQWLDAISARALRYAFRRLDREPVVLLATERPVAGERAELVVPADRVEQLVLGPLSLDAIRHVVRTVVGDDLPARAGADLRALRRQPAVRDRAGPIRRVVRGTRSAPPLHRRCAECWRSASPTCPGISSPSSAPRPPSARRRPADLARACDDPDAARLISAAVDEGLLIVGDDGVVRFTHPLLASVVLDGTNPLERTALHARLADGRHRSRRPRPPPRRCPAASLTRPSPPSWNRPPNAPRGVAPPAVAAELARHSLRVTPRGDASSAARRALAGISSPRRRR